MCMVLTCITFDNKPQDFPFVSFTDRLQRLELSGESGFSPGMGFNAPLSPVCCTYDAKNRKQFYYLIYCFLTLCICIVVVWVTLQPQLTRDGQWQDMNWVPSRWSLLWWWPVHPRAAKNFVEIHYKWTELEWNKKLCRFLKCRPKR